MNCSACFRFFFLGWKLCVSGLFLLGGRNYVFPAFFFLGDRNYVFPHTFVFYGSIYVFPELGWI